LFALFSKYCEGLNLSVNEGLSLLVKDEIEAFKTELTDEQQEEILEDFRNKKGIFLRNFPPGMQPSDCVHPHGPISGDGRGRGRGGRPPTS
jgi:hypothetical protein